MTSRLADPLRRILGGRKDADTKANEEGPFRAEVLAICAQKGGVGKTTTAVNLAAALARFQGKKVLLLDMDPQGHCALALHQSLNAPPADTPTLSEILLNLNKGHDIFDGIQATHIDGLDLCPSDKSLAQAEAILASRIGKEFLLKRALRRARTHYELIIIDCPPNLGTLTLNALMAADWLLAPCDMSTLAVEGIGDIFDTVQDLYETLDHRLNILGVLRTRFDAKTTRVNEAVDALLEPWSRHLIETRIPLNTALAQAQLAGLPVFDHQASARGAKAYKQVAEDIATRLWGDA